VCRGGPLLTFLKSLGLSAVVRACCPVVVGTVSRHCPLYMVRYRPRKGTLLTYYLDLISPTR